MIIVNESGRQYEWYEGTKSSEQSSNIGAKCDSIDICEDCTFGNCLHRALSSSSEGFSYSNVRKSCRLCTEKHFKNLKQDRVWGVYKKGEDVILMFSISETSN